jgi:hypothetical protein
VKSLSVGISANNSKQRKPEEIDSALSDRSRA